MRLSLTLFAALLLTANVTTAGELDNENTIVNAEQKRLAEELPATVVVRVSEDGSTAEVLHSASLLAADATSHARVLETASEFKPMAATDQIAGELDRDSSSSSWYFYFYNYSWYYPTYYYYGYTYNYRSYYSYWYGGWNYRYYRW